MFKISWEKREILLVVKTYPARSKKYGDIVCTAGILEDTNEWIRIYPIDWLEFVKKGLKKFVRIEGVIKKDTSDYLHRKESHKIRKSSIKVIDDSLTKTQKKGVWTERKKILLNVSTDSLKTLNNDYKVDKTSLGMIKPNERKLKFYTVKPIDEIEINVEESTQYTILGEKLKKVDAIEKAFKYKFKCGYDDCKGHNMICEDWELLQAFRNFTSKYGVKGSEKHLKFKFEEWMLDKRELYFILGMHWRYPKFMIIGLFYPPK